MSLLTIIQEACSLIGILKPNAVYSSTDQQIVQLRSIANEEGQELARYPWQSLTLEATFTTVASESQGVITAIAPGYKSIINNTIWNRSLLRPVFGPMSPSEWQQLKAQTMSGPFNQFRIVGNLIKFTPVPTAGESCYFEYLTKNWVTSGDGLTSRSAWGADDDISLLDEDLMTSGIIWRWKQIKGLQYAEDFNKYERHKMDLQATNGGKPTLNLNGTSLDIYPGVIVPSGSWGIP